MYLMVRCSSHMGGCICTRSHSVYSKGKSLCTSVSCSSEHWCLEEIFLLQITDPPVLTSPHILLNFNKLAGRVFSSTENAKHVLWTLEQHRFELYRVHLYQNFFPINICTIFYLWLGVVDFGVGQRHALIYAILCRGLEHSWILVSIRGSGIMPLWILRDNWYS